MGLENIIKPIVLDVSVSKYVAVILKQYDKNIREIIVTVTDNGKPYLIDTTITPRVKFKKNDNTFGMNDCEILNNGNIKIEITEQMTAVSGISDYELVLFDVNTDKILHTMNFVINVRKSVCSDDEITSTNEFKSFESGLLSISKMEIAVDKMKSSVTEMETIVAQTEQNVNEIKAIIEGDELIHSDQLGVANGVATLNENGLISEDNLPSYVDDVIEGIYSKDSIQFFDLDGNVIEPEKGKIYVDVNESITYRWSGTVYVEIGGGYEVITEDEIRAMFKE